MTENDYDKENEKNPTIDELLVKVMLGEASGQEEQWVKDWVSESNRNARYFEDFKLIWEESRNLAVQSTVNENDAWQNFQQRVKEENTPVINLATRRKYQWLKAAAIFAVLLTGGWLYTIYSDKQPQFLSLHSEGVVLTDTLSEGSIVVLNKQSSIRYKQQFPEDSRPVELEGEAFFKVSPDKNKPFIVHAREVTIKVIGTSFNVRTTKQATELIVETGMVEITKGGHTISVRANEKVIVRENDPLPEKQGNTDELYNYYRTHEFACNGISLERLVDKLNEVYKANIVIGNDRLRNMALTTTFRDESLDEILYIISQTFKISLVKNGQQTILK
ncbi:FecR family protein [Flavitalea flava]